MKGFLYKFCRFFCIETSLDSSTRLFACFSNFRNVAAFFRFVKMTGLVLRFEILPVWIIHQFIRSVSVLFSVTFFVSWIIYFEIIHSVAIEHRIRRKMRFFWISRGSFLVFFFPRHLNTKSSIIPWPNYFQLMNIDSWKFIKFPCLKWNVQLNFRV